MAHSSARRWTTAAVTMAIRANTATGRRRMRLSGRPRQPTSEKTSPHTARARNPTSRSQKTEAKERAPPADMPTSTMRYTSPPMDEGMKRLKKVATRWLATSRGKGMATPSEARSRPHFQEFRHVLKKSIP